MAAILIGTGLTKEYRVGDQRLPALKRISLEVHPGEMVAVLGKPGSGKSTLLHILGCRQKPDSGRVVIDGQDVGELTDKEMVQFRSHKIGLLFQAFNLLPNDTVTANVEIWSSEAQERERKRRAWEALKVVGLENRTAHMPGQLSARQRQMVGIARALVNDAPVILADDPARGLDSSAREEIMGIFQKLNDQGKTILVSTSDTGVARYCRRAVTLSQGEISADEMIPRRRIIPPSRIPGTVATAGPREEELVCPRCNHGNPQGHENCAQCGFPLLLTVEESRLLEDRLRATNLTEVSVESATDEGEVPARGLVDELRKIPFFAELGPMSLARVIPALEGRLFSRGATIIKQGEPGDALYIIRSGQVDVVLERQGRPPLAVAHMAAGECVGEMALLADDTSRSATVLASTDVEVWRLSKAAFRDLLSENVSLSLFFSRIITRRIRALHEKITP